jgi:NAD(P)-dependent dehydrogenase (short-subunit alcohol dehydrogenase family)
LLDVTDAGTIARAAATVPELDVLVNNAGISLDTGAQVTETDVEVFRRTYETNVFGVVAVTNAFLPALRRSAHPRDNHSCHHAHPAVAGEGARSARPAAPAACRRGRDTHS